MRAYSLDRLSDGDLLRALAKLAAQERTTTVELVAHIAEVDVRQLFVPAGYSSMHEYCVQELRLSEDAAYKRIQVARAARDFPALLTSMADGRLHLTGACLLAPHLRPDNVDELLATATHRRKSEIELMVAHRFPRADVPTRVQTIPTSSPSQLAPAQVPTKAANPVGTGSGLLGPAQVESRASEPAGSVTGQLAPAQVAQFAPPPKVTPLAPQRFAVQFTMRQDTHDKLRYAQELLSHQVPSGDIAQVLDRALDALIKQLEKSKFAATGRPRTSHPSTSANKRHIPAHVKRAVRARDQGQCTFVGDTGHRCGSRRFLEFDHADPLARGGRATVENIRLRCRVHNHYEAEKTYGDGFMHQKREAARPKTRSAGRIKAPMAASAYTGRQAPQIRTAVTHESHGGFEGD